jgi:hypothetical protein
VFSSVADPDPTLDPAPDPAIFVSDLQDAIKKSVLYHYFLKVHLHHSLQIKSHKEATK